MDMVILLGDPTKKRSFVVTTYVCFWDRHNCSVIRFCDAAYLYFMQTVIEQDRSKCKTTGTED